MCELRVDMMPNITPPPVTTFDDHFLHDRNRLQAKRSFAGKHRLEWVPIITAHREVPTIINLVYWRNFETGRKHVLRGRPCRTLSPKSPEKLHSPNLQTDDIRPLFLHHTPQRLQAFLGGRSDAVHVPG